MEDAVSFFVGQGSYGLMILALVAAGLGLPLPEDIVMISGAILAQQGKTDLWMTVAALALGVFLGDSALYWVARSVGPAVYKWRLVQRVMPKTRRDWVEDKIEKHGGWVVFFARHVAGFRGATFAICAIHGITYPRFIAWDLLALLISLPVWMGIGWFLGSSMDELEKVTKNAELAITIGVVGVILLLLIGHTIASAIRKRATARIEQSDDSAGPPAQ